MRDFPGGSVVKTLELSLQGTQIPSLFVELRFHMPGGVAKKSKMTLTRQSNFTPYRTRGGGGSKLKVSKRKEIKIRAETNELEIRKRTEKIKDSLGFFLKSKLY